MGRRLGALALAVAAVVGTACGGSDPAPPPTPPPDTGSPPVAPGSSPTPPSAPAGPSTPTPPPADTPAPPSGTPPAGALPPDAAPPPGGTTPTACAGLLPDAPGPGVAHAEPKPLLPSCDVPITDGHGEWIGVGFVFRDHAYHFVSATAPGEPTGNLALPLPPGGGTGVAPQPNGYHAVNAKGFPGAFQRYDAKGALLSDDGGRDAVAIAGVPGGGSVRVTVEGPHPGPGGVYRLVWMSEAGERRAEALMPGIDPLFAVSSTGSVLAFAAGQARWYDRDGAPLTGWFSYGGDARALWRTSDVLGAVALADGSVVIGLDWGHPLRFEAASTRSAPPPDWVASRAGAAIAAVRGGRANAFARVTSPGNAGCEVKLEITTPAGESCGALTLAAAEPCGRVTFGADRTVFATGETLGTPTCVWHWWSGLLR